MSDKARYVIEDILQWIMIGLIVIGFTMISLAFIMLAEDVGRYHVDGRWMVVWYGYGGMALMIVGPIVVLMGLEKIAHRYI